MTRNLLIKKLKRARATKARHALGSSYNTRAAHDERRFLKQIKCFDETGNLNNWSNYGLAQID